MISTKGSIFYQDSYQIIYESTWHTFDDRQIVEYITIKKDPIIPGAKDEYVYDLPKVYKKGVITVERALLKLNGFAGTFNDRRDLRRFTVKDPSITFNVNQHLGKIVSVRNVLKDEFDNVVRGADGFIEATIKKARIISVVNPNQILLDIEFTFGNAFVEIVPGYEVLAESNTTDVDFFQIVYPYSDRPVDRFRFHLDSAYDDQVYSHITDGIGWSDTVENTTEWAVVQAGGSILSTDTFQFIDVWGS